MILITLGLGVAAINTGNNLLYLIFSVALSLIILSGVLSEMDISGIDAAVVHLPDVTCGGLGFASVRLSSRRRFLQGLSLCVSLETEPKVRVAEGFAVLLKPGAAVDVPIGVEGLDVDPTPQHPYTSTRVSRFPFFARV